MTSADFVAAWNASEACREIGEARLASSTSTHYDAALLHEIFIGVSTGVVSAGLYDLIKQVLVQRGVQKHTHIEETKKPDGTEMLVIDIDEK